jgi:hypothetical protein
MKIIRTLASFTGLGISIALMVASTLAVEPIDDEQMIAAVSLERPWSTHGGF